jgi:FHS family glucose/mannose:H+ symporter-like MFS transporter
MYNRKFIFIASCLGMLMFGIVMTTLGAILPSVIEKFGIDKANAGSLMLLMSFGILLGSLVFGPIVDRYGYKALLIICAALISIGLEGIALTPTFWLLRIAAFIIGFGGGVINGGTNALVADISEKGKSANLSILGVFFGVGAVGVPFLLGVLSGYLSYELIIAGVGLVVILPLLFFIVLQFPIPKQVQGFPIKEGLQLLKEFTLIFFGFILFFQSGIEFTIGGWAALFFKEELVLNTNRAVLFLSFYWLGMIIARLLLGYLLNKISPVIIQFSSIGIAFIGALAMLLSNSLPVSVSGLFLIGFGFAAAFPVMLGYVGDLYAKLSGTAFSIIFVMALMGGMLFPYFAGVVGQMLSLRLSFIIVPISLCCIATLFWTVLNRISITNTVK